MEEQYKSDEQLRRNQFRGEQFGADEVELKDYLIVLWKWKWLIILGTFITTFTAGVVSFMLPKVYKISSIIQPPRVAFLNEGNVQLRELESPITLKGIIEGRTFDEQIMRDLNLKEGEMPKIKLQIPRDTTLIDLSIESAKPNQAKLVLEKLTSILREHYRDRINLEKDNIDTKIRELNIKIENLKNKIIFGDEDYKTNKENLEKRTQLTKEDYSIKKSDLENKIKTTEEDYNIKKKDLENKIKTTEEDHKIKIENMKKKIEITKEDLSVVLKQKEVVNQQLKETKERLDKLAEERRKVQANNPNDAMAVLLYTNDMQNNQRYYNDLQTRLTLDLELRERDLKKTIEDSQRESDLLEVSLKKSLEEFNNQMETLENNFKKSMQDLKNQLEILENNHKSNLESLQYDLEMLGINYKKNSEELQRSIESSQIQVENFKFLKNNIQEFKIHKYPIIPERSIKPKKRLNVMIAFFAGGFLMVFLAFFLEYLSKIKLTENQQRVRI
ncbi:MAG: Wzz/FepE/Etk N-terminal domain-containing protein [Acidobacteriota bacterium]